MEVRRRILGTARDQDVEAGLEERIESLPVVAVLGYTSPPRDVNAFAEFCGTIVRRCC